MKLFNLLSFFAFLIITPHIFSAINLFGDLDLDYQDVDVNIIGDCFTIGTTASFIAATQDVTITIGNNVSMNGKNGGILWLGAYSPYTLTIKVNHSLSFYGGSNDVNDSFKIIEYGDGKIVWDFSDTGKLTFGSRNQSGNGELWIQFYEPDGNAPEHIFKPKKENQIIFKKRSKYGYIIYDNFTGSARSIFTTGEHGSSINVSFHDNFESILLLKNL